MNSRAQAPGPRQRHRRHARQGEMTMPIPQVNDRIKEAPVVVLRAVFAGIGQLLLTADKVRARAAEQVWSPDRVATPHPASPSSGWHAAATATYGPATKAPSATKPAPPPKFTSPPEPAAAKSAAASPPKPATPPKPGSSPMPASPPKPAATTKPAAAKPAPATKATPAAKPASAMVSLMVRPPP